MSTRTPPPPHSPRLLPDELVWAASLFAGILVPLFGGLAISSLLAGDGLAYPRSSRELFAVLGGLFEHPADPGATWPGAGQPGPGWVSWTLIGLLLAAAAAITVLVTSALDDRRARRRHRHSGLGTREELRRVGIDATSVVAAARKTRHSLAGVRARSIDAAEIAIALGRNVIDAAVTVYLKANDCLLIFGPTGSGKTWRMAYQRCLDAPGWLLVTTTKVDLIAATIFTRAEQGRVAVFDPENITKFPHRVRWSVLHGCEDPEVAMRRARALVAAMPMSGTTDASYWEKKASVLLRCYLHAAAVSGATIGTVRLWANSSTGREPKEILRAAMPSWAAELEQILGSGSDSKDDMIGATTALLDPLASPATLAAIDVPIAESFDLEQFVHSTGDTLYLVSKGDATSTAPFIAAMAAEVHFLADQLSQTKPGGRLDPPARLVLDEVNNVAPIPELPAIMSDSGGRGITIHAFAHNAVQNQKRWGNIDGILFGDNAPAQLILPGMRGRQIEELSRSFGDRWEWEPQTGGRDQQPRLRSVPVLTADEITQMDSDHALLVYRNAAPIKVALPSVWDDTSTAARVKGDQDRYQKIVETGVIPKELSPNAPRPTDTDTHTGTVHP